MNDLPLGDGFSATAGRFLWHAESATAILSDLHIGIEKGMARHGIAFPHVNDRGIRHSWEGVKARQPRRVIVAGDLFDAAVPDDQSVEVVRELLRSLAPGTQVILIPGNHDPAPAVLREVFRTRDVSVAATARVGAGEGYVVIHGHRWADLDETTPVGSGGGIIVGHQHPAVVMRDRLQAVKMICFAATRVKVGARSVPLLLLPTFSTAPLGTNLLSQGKWILDCPAPAAAQVRIAGIVRDQVLDFGPMANLPTA